MPTVHTDFIGERQNDHCIDSQSFKQSFHSLFDRNLLFSNKNKSTGSEAEKGGNVFEDISDILLRQVILS